ncbi:MAG: ATP-binding protein [Chlamydiae bacterium]|nr:ATP-binding protein [Chlamydiota bacterium]MBI3266753.1 ATP-binding protein [Chlamydiota bacterium]
MVKAYLHRWIESSLQAYLKEFPVVGLMGPRQSGKSTTLQYLLGAQYKYVSFDSPSQRERAQGDPELLLDELGERVIFDEIQYVPSLLSYLKIRVDQRRDIPGQYVITGSQQFSLMKGLTETLAGRIGLLCQLPFASLEELEAKKIKKSSKDLFVQYSLRGSYPELVAHPKKDVGAWYESYVNTYLERDVQGIYQIGHLRDFRRFLILLASRCGQIFNMSSFANDVGVSVPTIQQWASILEASWIIYFLQPYHENFGKRIVKSPKLYFLDTALAAQLVGIDNAKFLMQGPMAGALFENYIVSETLKCYRNRGKIPRLYYWRTSIGLEVDLLMEEGGRVYPVECKLAKTVRSSMAETLEKFVSSLPQERVGKGRVVCLCEESISFSHNVSFMNGLDYFKNLEPHHTG